MQFNDKKFELLRYGRSRDELKDYVTSQDQEIERKENLCDLGIQFSSDGTFKVHIANIAQKCRGSIGWILRVFKSRDSTTMMTLFKSLVLPHLEYCSPLWSPCAASSIRSLESIQQAFTRRIDYLSGKNRPNYWQRLSSLKIYSLERRRERYILLYLVKIINNRVPNPGVDIRTNQRTGIYISPPPISKTSPAWVSRLKRESFLHKGSLIFNCLPSHLRMEENIRSSQESFKSKLDNFLQLVPDQITVPGLVRAANSNSLVDHIHYLN